MTRSPDLLLRSIGPSGRSYDRASCIPPLARVEAIRLLPASPNHPVIIAPGSTPMGPYFLVPGWLQFDPTFDGLRLQPRFQKLVEGTA